MEQRRRYQPEIDGYRGLECPVCEAPATEIMEPGSRVNNSGQVPMTPRIVCSDPLCTTHAKVSKVVARIETPYDKYIWPGLLEIFRI